ncbi:MAG: aldo/keto reductase [Lachnospiraceae bacterium]|nr:aldo/keto reductase [Lachnospiraceae bacterium]
MQYRRMKDGSEVSILGFGCMRFPMKGAKIDYEETEKQIVKAVQKGINYYDTAYIYPGSEETLGTILQKNNLRDMVYIATKLPQYMVKKPGDIDKYFNEELSRLKTDYVDFYLMHMLADVTRWNNLKECGIEEWIAKKKESGQIRNVGFSFHGDTDTFKKLIDAYDWDFCQIQYNYLDENTQAGRKGLKYAAKKGIPVVIMEPLRGGRLVNFMPETAKKLIADYKIKRSPAEWAFRWLWNQPQVTCVLSGMNSMEMLEENMRVASEVMVDEFTEEDKELIAGVRNEILRTHKVGCTGCGYCMPCPKGVDIPTTFACYNSMYTENKNKARVNYMMNTSMKKEASDFTKCVECGKCEQHCPQHLEIRKELKVAGKHLRPWYFKIGLYFSGLFLKK